MPAFLMGFVRSLRFNGALLVAAVTVIAVGALRIHNLERENLRLSADIATQQIVVESQTKAIGAYKQAIEESFRQAKAINKAKADVDARVKAIIANDRAKLNGAGASKVDTVGKSKSIQVNQTKEFSNAQDASRDGVPTGLSELFNLLGRT